MTNVRVAYSGVVSVVGEVRQMLRDQNAAAPSPRAFISYARADGEDFALELRKRLEREASEITLWQDRGRMEGGIGWWKQIVEAIDAVEFLIMVMTPGALRSETAAREWRYARQQGVRICPIKAVPDSELEFSALPTWMRRAHFYDPEREWPTLLAFLRSPGKDNRVPFMAPDLREDFVQRPAEFASLVSSVIDPTRGEPIAVTTSIRGSGGFGKTTLAIALCHHPDVINSFDDGILWATLGEHPNVQQALTKLYAALTGERPQFVDADDAAIQLAARLDEKQCLMVVDDAWSSDDVKPFLRGGKQCTRLITTRLLSVVTEVGAHTVVVNEMTSDQSIEMLTKRLPCPPQDLAGFRGLAARLGEWPLVLRLAASQIRERVERGDSIEGALGYVNRAFDKRGPSAFDRANDAVTKTVSASLEILPVDDRRRCAELAIFPEDIPIPLRAACALWKLDELDAEEVAQRLDGAALVDFDLKVACIRIHDVLQSLLRAQLPDVPAVHARLVHDGWGDLHCLPDGYAWRWVGWHLARARELEQLQALLLDYRWLQAKLRATDVEALLQDFELVQNVADTRMVYDCLRLASSGLAFSAEQLPAQLAGRLDCGRSAAIDRLLAEARLAPAQPWLTFSHASLTHPGGALLGIFKGHAKTVEAVVVSKSGRRVLSASGDWTIRVWNADTGRSSRVLEGHEGPVYGIDVTSDGLRAASGSEDRSIRIWNLERGQQELLLRGHYGAVTCVTFSANDQLLASASEDGTVRVWDLQSATPSTPRLVRKGTSHQLHSVAFTRDSRHILFAAGDWTIVMVDIETSAVARVFEGHTGIVRALAVSGDDSLLLSTSQDGTLRLWDLRDGRLLRVFEGHADSVDAVAMTPDGRVAASGSADRTVRVWSVATGQALQVLEGHSGGVRSVAITANGHQALSSSADRTIRHWNLDFVPEVPAVKAHTRAVSFLAISADGTRAVSGTRNGLLHIWDAEHDRVSSELGRADGHKEVMTSLRLSSDGDRAVTSSRDKTLRVWDLRANKLVSVLGGHTRAVQGLQASRDHTRAISLSGDRTVRLWDLVRGIPLRILVAEDSEKQFAAGRGSSALLSEMGIGPLIDVAPFAIHGDGEVAISRSGTSIVYGSYGRLCSWDLETGATRCEEIEYLDVTVVSIDVHSRLAVVGSRFGRLRVWDLQSGETVGLLEGHTGHILDVVNAPDGESVITAARDNSIRIWDLRSCKERALLVGYGDRADAVAIAPNGAYAYAIYGDTIAGTSIASGNRIGNLSLDHQITALAVTPDGTRLALGDQSGRVHFVRVDS